ncbi:MAG: hypothetical protein ACLQQ4_18040 [Bacteroidia bacterium]
MGRISKYTDFYSDRIFDDEETEKETKKKFEFTGPLKLDDVPAHQIKKMDLLHSLMQQWDIENHNMVAYLMRFIFKAYTPDSPDEQDFADAIVKLKAIRKRAIQRQENNESAA